MGSQERLSVLAYADDLVFLSSTAEGAQHQLDRLAEVAGTVGLSINTKKIELLTIPSNLEANITGLPVPQWSLVSTFS